MSNNKEKILAAIKTFDLSEVKLNDEASIYVRRLSIAQSMAVQEMDNLASTKYVLDHCICYEDGEPVEDEVKQLIPSDLAFKIIEMATGLENGEKDSNKEAMGKSGTTQP